MVAVALNEDNAREIVGLHNKAGYDEWLYRRNRAKAS